VAKTLNIPTILVGHVTKEGMVAGPMVLSHMVDTVLFLEGERNTGTRILRSLKNRFGPIDEVGIFAMQDGGMEEITNPEQVFLTKGNGPGSVLVANLEGTRAFLVEVQALLVFSKLPMPRRVASGIDYRRLELLLAVLQKHLRLPVEQMDVFVNVAGGLKINDPACDLGICLAILSSIKNINLSKYVGIAEVGLLGELRTPSFLDKRIKEAKKLGLTKIITPKNYKSIEEVARILSK
jgi:DNA repair protein RadA/Sms